jgi:signal transduction histidine kinase
LGSLTAGIAHEIKNPLNFVNNFAELSKELVDELEEELAKQAACLSADARGYIEDTLGDLRQNLTKINEHGKRADSIVRNMLAHSRGKPGEKQMVEVNTLLDEYVNLAYHGVRARDSNFNLSFERSYDPSVGQLLGVPQDLSRVFLNLLNNGFYAVNERAKRSAGTNYSPKINITTRKMQGGGVEIKIRDNGIGISPENIEKLFTPFFTTKPTGEGTGLGLSMSHDIVTQGHGGELLVESVVGEYAEFTVRLPG